jgi:hypothetical protein
LKETEFRKGTKEATEELRKYWENKSNQKALKKEWTEKTGKDWPVYESDGSYGKITFKKGQPVLAHHIIELSHGGPNAWWNIAPMDIKDHVYQHSKEGSAYKIFRQNIKNTKEVI